MNAGRSSRSPSSLPRCVAVFLLGPASRHWPSQDRAPHFLPLEPKPLAQYKKREACFTPDLGPAFCEPTAPIEPLFSWLCPQKHVLKWLCDLQPVSSGLATELPSKLGPEETILKGTNRLWARIAGQTQELNLWLCSGLCWTTQ